MEGSRAWSYGSVCYLAWRSFDCVACIHELLTLSMEEEKLDMASVKRRKFRIFILMLKMMSISEGLKFPKSSMRMNET